ncbi:MAG: PEPxxWA-CTERM sorting domain-containing protein, partial [Thermaurantiacus sp.]
FCNGNFTCDFGNTSAIRFSAMPDGLSWTSQSGVFLSAIGNGGGGGGGGVIPEPATWAMLIAGFGLVGGAARRRRASGAETA